MPQAETELRELMALLFNNDGVSDKEPYEFLMSRGYTEENGTFDHPDKEHFWTAKEVLCLRFMMTEWDYGIAEEKDEDRNNS